MAKFHQLVSEKNKYIIADILYPKDDAGNDMIDATYRFIKLTTATGVSVFNRFIISADDTQYTKGDTIELYQWSMDIIPVKVRNKQGDLKVLRTVSGLSATEPECESAASRAAQRLYDTAEEVADSAEARALARKNVLFCNFVDRNTFIESMNDDED